MDSVSDGNISLNPLNVKVYTEGHNGVTLRNLINNLFAGKGICGFCGQIFGRKVWSSTDERHRRIICRCNSKYLVKGKKGCESRHVDNVILYQALVNT